MEGGVSGDLGEPLALAPLASLQDAVSVRLIQGYRSAQPLANRSQASGLNDGCALGGDPAAAAHPDGYAVLAEMGCRRWVAGFVDNLIGGAVSKKPIGFSAISRAVERSDTHGTPDAHRRHPEGMPAPARSGLGGKLRNSR